MTELAGSPITPDTVRAAALLADLPLSEQRLAEVAGLLAAWVPAANALSARMRADDVRELMPSVAFIQGPDEDGGSLA